MNRRIFYEKVIYGTANAAILTGIGLFTPVFGISAVTGGNILVALVILALSAGISLLPMKGRAWCLLFAVIGLGIWIAVTGAGTSIHFLQDYLKWCTGYAAPQGEWRKSFELMHTAVITAASLLVQSLLDKFRTLKICLAFAVAVGLAVCLPAQVNLPHLSAVFLFFYIAVIHLERLQERWKKERSGSLKGHMLWLSPFLCVYLLLMAVMPAPEKPYDWQWAKNLYEQMRESFLVVTQNIKSGGQEDFDTSLSGFSDDGELGGDVRENDRGLMRIQAGSSLATNVYLTGKIYDTFNGRQWFQEVHGDEKERFIDTLETLCAVRGLEDSYQQDYLTDTNINIRYEFFNTRYVFAPLKARYIRGSGSGLNYSFDGGDLRLESRKGYGTEYDVAYYQLNLGEELFEQLLKADNAVSEELWAVTARERESEIGERITPEMLEAHRRRIYEHYLTEVQLSREAESYLAEITSGAETDLERLQAIERELRSFTYTRSPGALPDKVIDAGGFLDYFLLESRQGYCTYFATAFVLLARAEGIPARYAQGFCVPMSGSREAVVLASMAHSWPEVYIEGVGWIPFEPTPGYEGLRYTPWRVRDSGSASSHAVEEDGGEKEPADFWTGLEGEAEMADDPAVSEAGNKSDLKWLWRGLGLGIPAILAGVVSVLVLNNLFGMYLYWRMDLTERLRTEVRRNLRVLAWLGIKRQEQETLQRLRERGRLMPEMPGLQFIEDYEAVVYGGKKAEEEMLAGAREERKQLWRLVRKEKKWTYLFCRIMASFSFR